VCHKIGKELNTEFDGNIIGFLGFVLKSSEFGITGWKWEIYYCIIGICLKEYTF